MPKEYVNILRSLQDKGAEIPFNEIKIVFEHDLGKPISDVFSEFDETPIASASLAQVHRAVLKESGDEVAVKM